MRFPLRLTAELTLGLAARSLRLNRKHPLILNVAGGGDWKSPKSPIVWMGGDEPLDFAESPQIANTVAASGRHVFLPTSGVLLRRRIHEFQPSPRLHLTIRFDGGEAAHDHRVGQLGAYRDALESVRTARLSGFLLCAQLILRSASEAAELEQLYRELGKLDFDGFLISLAAPAPAGDELQRSVSGLRKRLLSRRWALLSALLDAEVLHSAAAVPGRVAIPAALGISRQPPARSYEESVQGP